ncbi:ULK/ULK protein kinase [Melampsora americana]|nr:ULK/ULK protein kinase [Melampsora americana]
MADNRKYHAQSSRAKPRDLEVPHEIPGFTIGDEIGRGSFAVVYEGVNTHTKQKVAIKAVIKSKLTTKLFQNLQDEINILKQIRHGNVVGLVDCISTNDYIFLVMQYCAEGDLSVYIKSKSKASNQDNQQIAKPLDIRSVASSAHPPASERFPHPTDGGLNEWVVRSFLGQLADALQFLRSHSIIHRDIKPQNLLLHPSSSPTYPSHGETPPPGMTFTSNKMGTTHEQGSGAGLHRHVPPGIPILRVADFGFARVLETNSSLAETLCGSPLYMAPEILRYEKYDAKADLWSVGAVLYEMSVGKPPFRAQNHVELLRKIEKSEDKIVFPEEKSVAHDIKSLIKCLLKQNPIERISFPDFFRRAEEVSLVGILAPPKQTQRTKSSQPVSLSSTRIHSQQIPSRTNSDSGGLPKPPSTSSLPIPTSPSHSKPRRSITLNPFEGEQGAFIIDKASTLTRHNSTNTAKLPSSGTRASKATTSQPTNVPSTTTHLGSNAPSPSVLPLPSTGACRPTVPTFPAKYVIVQGGCSPGSSPQVAVGVKTKDYAHTPGSKPANSSSPKLDDADDFGKEYVVVEKRSVEINSLVDDLASSPLKPMSLTRRMSRGFMPRPTHSGLSGSPHHQVGRFSPPSSSLPTTALGVLPHTTSNPSFPPQPKSSPSPPSSGTHPMMITNIGRSSPSYNYHYNGYPSSPRSFDSSGGGGGIGSLPIVGKYFPQSYNSSGHSPRSGGAAHDGTGTSYFSFPNSPLARAIMSSNAALNSRSLKPIQHQTSLFPHNSTPSTSKAMVVGTSHSQRPPSGRYSIDSVEAELMNELEKFASKVLVILQFADEKLAKILPPTPSSTSSTPQPMTAASYSPPTSIGAFAPLTKHSPNHLSKTSSEGTASSSLTAIKADKAPGNHKLAAGEAMVLYIKALAFLDKGIRHAVSISTWRKDHQGGTGFSPDVTFAIEWMRNKFNEVFDKAEFAKSKSPDQMLKNGIYAEKLIYDRALEKSRSAAVNELMGEHSIECELEYETSLWMLYSLLDPTMKEEDLQEDEDDREMIERFVVSIKTRLSALRRKMVSGT